MTATQRYFDRHACAFDRVYDEPGLVNRLLRPGPRRGLKLAASVVGRRPHADVLDLGCGPGRVAEAVLEAGAGTYVGIDFSPQMLALARGRLERFGSVELLEGDFLGMDVREMFDVVLALGLFEYLEEPARAAEWIRARCTSTLVASFPRWDWVKGPIRRVRYGLVHRCRIFDYTEADAEALLVDAGFSSVEFHFRGRRGFFVSAGVARAGTPSTSRDYRVPSAFSQTGGTPTRR